MQQHRGTPASPSRPGRLRAAGRLLALFLAAGAVACGSDDNGGGDGGSGDGSDGGGGGGGGDGGFDQPPLTDGLATLAGAGIPGDVDGPRNQALFDNPVNVVVAPDGNVLVADFNNSKIRQVTPEGDVSTISLTPEVGMFVRPFGMAVVGDTLFIQTDGNSLGQQGGAIWRMRLDGGPPELVRDNVGRPRGMALLPDGRIALADYKAHVVRLFDPKSGTMNLLAGTVDSPGFADGSGASAKFNEPYDVVVTPDGDLLVSDLSNHRIRRVTLGGEVTTFAGTGTPGFDDGPVGSATFNGPQGLAIDGAGNVFVTDTGNFVVRGITADGQVSTVAGDGSPGYRDAENPTEAQLFGLEGIEFDPSGPFLYISDGNRGEDGPFHRVRRCTLD